MSQPLPQRRRSPRMDRFVPAPPPPPEDDDDHLREINAIMDYFRRDDPQS
jgi:hypothetical protein